MTVARVCYLVLFFDRRLAATWCPINSWLGKYHVEKRTKKSDGAGVEENAGPHVPN
jgi:hypothetical protein